MRKVQLKFGKQHLRRGIEGKKHGNVALFHLASRHVQSNLRRKADREAQAGRNKKDGDKESTLQQTGKKKPWEYQSWAARFMRAV